MFTGQQYDSGTELYSLRARFYSPAQGRFLSRDPHPYNYRNPFELNRYVYTANNPATYVDPSGRSLAEIGKQISSAVKALQNGRWVAGATGGTFGAAAAAFVSTSMYWTARWGGCGEHLQDWAKSIDSASFVSISTIFGFISGFITGAYGPGAALAVHMVSTGTTFAISALDIMMNGPNLCNVATLIMAYISGSGSSGTNATLPVQVTAISGNGEVVLSLSGVNWIAVQSGFYNGLNLMFSSSAGGRDDSGFTGGSGGSNEPYEPIRRNNWENDPRFDDLATEVGSTDPNQGRTEAQGILEAENQGIISNPQRSPEGRNGPDFISDYNGNTGVNTEIKTPRRPIYRPIETQVEDISGTISEIQAENYVFVIDLGELNYNDATEFVNLWRNPTGRAVEFINLP